MLTQIINGHILTPQGWLKDGSVLISDGKILEVTNSDLAVIGAKVIDAKGMFIVPGFVSMHIHGGAGRDFTEATSDAFETIVRAHLKHGATTIFPTLSSTTFDVLRQATVTCDDMMKQPESIVQGAVILVPLDQTCGQQHIRLPPLGLHILQQPALLRSIADAELRHNPIRPSSLTDIVLSPRRRLQTADKPLGCQLVHIHYLCPAVLLLPLLRCQLALLILYVQPSGKILQRLIIGHPLQMHYKADGISRLVALAETVVDILGGGHHERGGLLVVERAAALIVCALPLQLDPLVLDYLHQVGILDLVLHIRRYHTPSPLRIIDRPFRTVWHRAKGDPLSDCQKPPFQKDASPEFAPLDHIFSVQQFIDIAVQSIFYQQQMFPRHFHSASLIREQILDSKLLPRMFADGIRHQLQIQKSRPSLAPDPGQHCSI